MTRSVTRRQSLAMITAVACAARPRAAQANIDPFAGAMLLSDVERYASLGSHRTSSEGDAATTRWLSDRFSALGFQVAAPSFSFPLFEPALTQISLGSSLVPAFPIWPPVETSPEGITAPLEIGASPNGVALIKIPYHPGASLDAPGAGQSIADAVRSGARAVVAVTEGPTGAVIAQNAAPSRWNWSVPVVLAPGSSWAGLEAAAADGRQATLISTGRRDPAAKASNVVARRRGQGKTVVISTPKSGWFSCAGERGPGIAYSLALASMLSARPDLDLLFLATSGHEIAGLGGKAFLDDAAPPPDSVRLWLHLGANLACDRLDLSSGQPQPTHRPAVNRGLLASPSLIAAAESAFAGQPGYETPTDAESPTAVGEVIVFRRAGYRPLLGLVGSGPLHHTPLDQPALATSASILQPVGRGIATLVQNALNAP